MILIDRENKNDVSDTTRQRLGMMTFGQLSEKKKQFFLSFILQNYIAQLKSIFYIVGYGQ